MVQDLGHATCMLESWVNLVLLLLWTYPPPDSSPWFCSVFMFVRDYIELVEFTMDVWQILPSYMQSLSAQRTELWTLEIAPPVQQWWLAQACWRESISTLISSRSTAGSSCWHRDWLHLGVLCGGSDTWGWWSPAGQCHCSQASWRSLSQDFWPCIHYRQAWSNHWWAWRLQGPRLRPSESKAPLKYNNIIIIYIAI